MEKQLPAIHTFFETETIKKTYLKLFKANYKSSLETLVLANLAIENMRANRYIREAVQDSNYEFEKIQKNALDFLYKGQQDLYRSHLKGLKKRIKFEFSSQRKIILEVIELEESSIPELESTITKNDENLKDLHLGKINFLIFKNMEKEHTEVFQTELKELKKLNYNFIIRLSAIMDILVNLEKTKKLIIGKDVFSLYIKLMGPMLTDEVYTQFSVLIKNVLSEIFHDVVDNVTVNKPKVIKQMKKIFKDYTPSLYTLFKKSKKKKVEKSCFKSFCKCLKKNSDNKNQVGTLGRLSSMKHYDVYYLLILEESFSRKKNSKCYKRELFKKRTC